MKYALLLLWVIPFSAIGQTQCFSDAMCPTGQECISITQHYSLCLPSSTNSSLNCKNCTNNGCTRPSAGVDADSDFISDRFEHDLAKHFFPNFMLRPHAEDTGEFYGTIRADDVHTIPYRIRTIYPSEISRSAVCSIFGPCLEIRYGLPYDYDHGDGALFAQHIDSHEGDSEFMAFVVFSTEPASTAFNNVNSWKIGLARVNHHTSSTIKTYYNLSFYPTFTQTWGATPPITVWSAEKKHATYFSQTQCNSSSGISFPFPGLGTLDDCSENTFNARSSVLDHNRLQNIGEPHGPIDSTIHYPNITSTNSCTEYDVWGYDSFANSSVYRTKFIEHLDW